ncbi:MAG: hypothetical protein KatS3mg031_2874 [Chitinophagales bacterium]|nr:MAG: hypothetical protein KatS3mg031_2874 [Chitinophagales bacterium]
MAVANFSIIGNEVLFNMFGCLIEKHGCVIEYSDSGEIKFELYNCNLDTDFCNLTCRFTCTCKCIVLDGTGHELFMFDLAESVARKSFGQRASGLRITVPEFKELYLKYRKDI